MAFAAALSSSVLLAPLAAFAAPAAATATSSAAADLVFVRWLSIKDPRQTVRSAAWTAIISSAQDRAIAQFLTGGYQSAKMRATTTQARNLDFAKRVQATSVPEVSPEVHEAARFAVDGTDTDRTHFARTGYAAAKQRDRLAREADGEYARALSQFDRDFVAAVRDHDPGEQVRASAAWALRTGATDSDVVEFLTYGWINGAALDLDLRRARLADSDTAWRTTVNRLVTEAQAAEQAALAAGQEGAKQARAAAARAWEAVGDQTGPARSAWSDAEAVAQAQAENWRAVAAAALAATGPNWAPIGRPRRHQRFRVDSRGRDRGDTGRVLEWPAEPGSGRRTADDRRGALIPARPRPRAMSSDMAARRPKTHT
ncbi:hypothetical protein [Actinoplanes sp. ATCC 53533]|uniref:hypothetical protein n=1 Tax=Actinoplanes sp. ATCC 53533 TaxID=1288362 RepID=UPI0018F2C05C|nr:hypothetical protein [Actinoplanes sp. ATCC 53533]